jgi:hypothetical protein
MRVDVGLRLGAAHRNRETDREHAPIGPLFRDVTEAMLEEALHGTPRHEEVAPEMAHRGESPRMVKWLYHRTARGDVQ